MVSFNFQGLEQETGVYDDRNGYVWDAYKIPCLNIVVDHPMYYHEYLLHVFGKDWDKRNCTSPQNIIRHPQTDSSLPVEGNGSAMIC